jgi:hypothetical protein
MKKPLFFILFCGLAFCAGCFVGNPFSKTGGPIASGTQGNPENVESLGLKAIPLAPQKDTLETKRHAKVSHQPQPALSSNPANDIANLSLAEVQARLQAMDGVLATAATEEMEELLVNRWSALDPIGASQFAADALAQGGNPELLQTASKAWAKTDPAGAAQWAANLETSLARDTAIGQIFTTWSSTDPVMASGAINALPLGSAQMEATSAVAKNFIKGNPDAALKWAEGLPRQLQKAATEEIVNFWSASDPAATGAWILKQPSLQTRSEALKQLAGNWVARDPGSALEYAQSIADPNLRVHFICEAMDRFSNMDPVAAADWLSSEEARPVIHVVDSSGLGLTADISRRWAGFDPGAASNWAASIPNSDVRRQAIFEVSTIWAESNPAAAAQWIGSIGEAGTRDSAIAAFSFQIAKADPGNAAQWATRISDSAERSLIIEKIVSDWRQTDPNAARLFVQSSNALPADLKKRLLR